jgi:hypothetical protein
MAVRSGPLGSGSRQVTTVESTMPTEITNGAVTTVLAWATAPRASAPMPFELAPGTTRLRRCSFLFNRLNPGLISRRGSSLLNDCGDGCGLRDIDRMAGRNLLDC